MNQKKLRKQVCLGLAALALASTSVMLMGTESVYAASARQQDMTIEQVENELANNPDNPVSFTQRIQNILDEYDEERAARRHSAMTRFSSLSDSTDVKTDTVADSDKESSLKPVPAEVEVKPAAQDVQTPAPAVPKPPAPAPQLKEGRYNFDWQGTPIAQSLYAVAKIAKKDVVVNGDISGKVFISLHNVTCNQAMDYLSNSFNFNWMVDGNAIIVSTEDMMLQSQVFKIHHAVDMDKLKEELKTLGIDDSRIYANMESRSVSVSGTPYQLRQAKLRLDTIDKPVSQCLVVAQLIEVSHGKSLNLGLSYSLPTYSHTGESSTSSSSGGSSSDDDSSSGSSGSSSSLKGPWLDKLTFSASSQAHRELSKGKVISRPMIMMMNGQEGMVNFGEQVPVLSATTTASSTDVTVTYNNVGTKLTITPSIDEENGEIAMKISAEVSNISQWRTSGSTTAPQISTRQATTSAHLHSGQSFVIGGLMNESELDNLSGIPGLMNLPILGNLFRLHTKSKSYAEVYIMITPYIVSDEIDPKEIMRKVEE